MPDFRTAGQALRVTTGQDAHLDYRRAVAALREDDLHVLDVLWTRHSAPLGTLVRYVDDFVVMCRTARDCERSEERIRTILVRLGLELHRD